MSHAARKRDRPRPRTKNQRALKYERAHNPALAVVPAGLPQRPRTRGECPDSRPCPWVGCRYHLYLDVMPRTGSIKLNFPDLEPWELATTCALDVAEHAGRRTGRTLDDRAATLDEVGEGMNLTCERVRQVEAHALELLRRSGRLPK